MEMAKAGTGMTMLWIDIAKVVEMGIAKSWMGMAVARMDMTKTGIDGTNRE